MFNHFRSCVFQLDLNCLQEIQARRKPGDGSCGYARANVARHYISIALKNGHGVKMPYIRSTVNSG